MIDIKDLRENPDRYRAGCRKKNIPADVDRALELDAARRSLQTEQQDLRNKQRTLEKDLGPKIGQLMGRLKSAAGAERDAIQKEADALKSAPAKLKEQIAALDEKLAAIDPELDPLLLAIPLPPDDDVPEGQGADDNVELSRWNPPGFDTARSFEDNRGFSPKTHIELVRDLGLCDFERGVKIAGTRSYILTADGFRLQDAVLKYALDFMTQTNGFVPVSVPVMVREEAMIGTAFFPAGREQAYLIDETRRTSPDAPTTAADHSRDLFLTGTGEVGLMGLHMDEILSEADLPLRYVTRSACFRREAGAAGKDTAGLYRVHQFDKVEQVVICRADEAESRQWHRTMISYVEAFLQSLELPYRLLQCCTGDLGPKNADMIDIESWMPGRWARGQDATDQGARPRGDFGETHSASRLYAYQCRRLNTRYRPGGEGGKGPTTICHSLNNTVAAGPRILIPLLEMHQNADGSVTIPQPLRPYMSGQELITPRR